MKKQAFLVHVLRETAPDQWYIAEEFGNIISPVCTSLEQLRWALAQMCNAVNEEETEIVR